MEIFHIFLRAPYRTVLKSDQNGIEIFIHPFLERRGFQLKSDQNGIEINRTHDTKNHYDS